METTTKEAFPQNGRRNFIRIGGLGLAVTGLALTGCSNDDDGTGNQDNQLPGMRGDAFDFGGGDLGILTYAYALEQLEAEFYTRVVNNSGFGTAFNADEQSILSDLYAHEVVHREFFRNLLTDMLPNSETQLLPALAFNFGSLNFGDRTAVLNMARTLEDTGVAAYNGSGFMLEEEDNLNLAGKIVSVEGRHASAIRSLINPDDGNFAPTALDPALLPSQVIAQINGMNLITTPYTANYLS